MTTKEYKNYVLDRLAFLGDIRIRPMMGEYLVYFENTLVGGIYDERLLLKKTKMNFQLPEQIPYPSAKPMLFIEDLENQEEVREYITKTGECLKK